jgi:hypothetical protein
MVATMRMARFNISDLLNARVARAQQNNKVAARSKIMKQLRAAK